MNRLPPWFQQEVPDQAISERVGEMSNAKVFTVCREAHCPNISRCFKNKQLTFLILGDICTRHCLFCAVRKADDSKAGDSKAGDSKALPVDEHEPAAIVEVIKKWELRYVVVTSVTRDDLADAGASQFCKVIKEVRSLGRVKKIEVLIPDLQGNESLIKEIVSAGPDVFGHNIETVRRLYPVVRPEAKYYRSLEVLKFAKDCDPELITKSSLMLGLGENEYDVYAAMEHLRNAKVDILTLGQYLAPSDSHYPVQEFVTPEQFKQYEDIARQFGFRAVLSGPLVRSSFCAEELYNSAAC